MAAAGGGRHPHCRTDALRRERVSHRQGRRKGPDAGPPSRPGPGGAPRGPWKQQQLFYVHALASGVLRELDKRIRDDRRYATHSLGVNGAFNSARGARSPPRVQFSVESLFADTNLPESLVSCLAAIHNKSVVYAALGAINTWQTFSTPVILPGPNEYKTPLGPALPSNTIPAGYTLTIKLGNDRAATSIALLGLSTGYHTPHRRPRYQGC